MRTFHRPKLWLGVWVFGWLLCIALSLLPPLPLDGPPDSDKWGHLLAYLVLSAWAVQIFRRPRAQALAALALFALGLAIEVAQAQLTTTRMGDPYDLVADTVGILLGLLFAAGASSARLLLRLDDRLFRRPA